MPFAVLVVLIAGSVPAPVSAAAPRAVFIADAIAPGQVTTQLGLGTGVVSVPKGGLATFMATTTPALRDTWLAIWVTTPGRPWRHVGNARTGSDGTARVYFVVTGRTELQARLSASSGHRAATSNGRVATVDPFGRNIVRVSCPEVSSWGAGSIAVRAVGTSAGKRVQLSLCHSGTSWTVADADSSAIHTTYKAAPASGGSDLFDFVAQKPGSRAVRLVAPAGKVGSGGQRTLLVLFEAPRQAIRVTRNVPLTPAVRCGEHARCTVDADIYAPTSGGPWPVVVFLRGGPGGLGARRGYSDFVSRLAAQGVVVYNVDYRDEPSVGGRYPLAFADAACAVRVARHTAARYGGSRATVTLVGHSLGAYVGSIISLSANAFASSCHATGLGAPDAFVGIAGPYDLDQPTLQGNFTSVLGGTRTQVPSAWQNGDPFNWIGRRQGVSFRLLQGDDDPTVDPAGSRALESALERASLDSSLTRVAGGTHVSLIAAGKDGDLTMAVILAALK